MRNSWIKIFFVVTALIFSGHAMGAPVLAKEVAPRVRDIPPLLNKQERKKALDYLLKALKVAPDEDSGIFVATKIEKIWHQSKSDTVTLLMLRVNTAMAAQDLDTALSILDKIVEIQADYIDGWNTRASIYYLKHNFEGALIDLAHVLLLEPRHFEALAGLGGLFVVIGDDRRALSAFRKALAIYPKMPGIADQVSRLSLLVEGRDI